MRITPGSFIKGNPIHANQPDARCMARPPVKTDTLLATPPVAVVAASVAGIALQDWVYILTITYTVFLIGEKLWKWFKAWQERKIFRAAMHLPPESEE